MKNRFQNLPLKFQPAVQVGTLLTHSLKAPGFQPFGAYEVKTWFQSLLFQIHSCTAPLHPGAVAVATITAVDAYGCPRSGGGETFVATLTRLSAGDAPNAPWAPSAAAQLTAVVVDNGDGTYRARLAAPAQGRYALDVALKDPSTVGLFKSNAVDP
jgi:hypothetical protein